MTGNTTTKHSVNWQKLAWETLARLNQPFDLAKRFL